MLAEAHQTGVHGTRRPKLVVLGLQIVPRKYNSAHRRWRMRVMFRTEVSMGGHHSMQFPKIEYRTLENKLLGVVRQRKATLWCILREVLPDDGSI